MLYVDIRTGSLSRLVSMSCRPLILAALLVTPLSMTACSDYNFNAEKEPEPGGDDDSDDPDDDSGDPDDAPDDVDAIDDPDGSDDASGGDKAGGCTTAPAPAGAWMLVLPLLGMARRRRSHHG